MVNNTSTRSNQDGLVGSASPAKSNREDRIRRNVACVNCRNSKVRCKASDIPGKPCTRCAKLQITCVVDKNHKRITKRSKLEQLEQELKSIREKVHPTAGSEESAWSAQPRDTLCSQAQKELPNTFLAGVPRSHSRGVPTPTTTGLSEDRNEPTIARQMGEHLVSGPDIDDYFLKYLTHFHPFIPVLRENAQIPNACYSTSPLLFWTVIYVSGRRYMKEATVMDSIIEYLSRDIWVLGASAAVSFETIHALLLICAWPFPTVRFLTDPSRTLSSLAMTACENLGLNFAIGNHPQYVVGPRQDYTSTDEEACLTWIMACIAANRAALSAGLPVPPMHVPDERHQMALADHKWDETLTLYGIRKFINRFSLAVASQIYANDCVAESTVQYWEDEFQTLRPAIVKVETDQVRFALLDAQMSIQMHYLCHPDPPSPSLRTNSLKLFHTARHVIDTIYDLETRSKFLSHSPFHVYRSILDAAAIIIITLNSTWAPALPLESKSVEAVNELAARSYGAVMRCSIRQGDLPYRSSVIVETFWNARYLMPLVKGAPKVWRNRLGSGILFWALDYFKRGLADAKKSTNRVNKGLEVIKAGGPGLITEQEVEPGRLPEVSGPPLPDGFEDPFQDVDWAQFMEDFGWGGSDPNLFMGISI